MSSHTGQPAQQTPTTLAAVGGIPAPIPDIPISASLIALFVGAGLAHLSLFLRNRKNNHKFFFSFLLFIFSCTRVAALSLRIAWSLDQHNANLTLAAGVLTSAGVLMLFIINLVLARRVVRALHPGFGWAKGVATGFTVLLASVASVLIMVVVCTVHSVLTLDLAAKARERQVLLFAGVYLMVVAFIPAVGMVVAKVVPNRGPYKAEGFGKGRMGTKMALLLFTSAVLTLGAGFRAGVNFTAKPASQPQWYHSRPAFYCFNFAIELVVVYAYVILRFDQIFYVSEGSSAPGHYSGYNLGGALEEEAHDLSDRTDSS